MVGGKAGKDSGKAEAKAKAVPHSHRAGHPQTLEDLHHKPWTGGGPCCCVQCHNAMLELACTASKDLRVKRILPITCSLQSEVMKSLDSLIRATIAGAV